MIGTIVKFVMGALFVWSAILQYNDPDSLAWIAIYGGAALLTLLSILGRGTYALHFVSSLAVLALFVWVARHVDTWTMESEVAREAAGLGIMFFWFVVMTWMERSRRAAFPLDTEFEDHKND